MSDLDSLNFVIGDVCNSLKTLYLFPLGLHILNMIICVLNLNDNKSLMTTYKMCFILILVKVKRGSGISRSIYSNKAEM